MDRQSSNSLGSPQEEQPPPFLGTWKRVYIAILIYLAALITVFYVFTQAYQR